MQVISPIYEPPDGSRQPGIYQINPKFSKIGKGFQVQPIDTRNAGNYVQFPHIVTITINGTRKTLRCGSIHQVIAGEKKGASAGHTDTTQDTNSPTTQDHHTQPNAENQEKVDARHSAPAFNMQNNALTAEEAKLFSQDEDEQPENPAYSMHNDTKEGNSLC